MADQRDIIRPQSKAMVIGNAALPLPTLTRKRCPSRDGSTWPARTTTLKRRSGHTGAKTTAGRDAHGHQCAVDPTA